MSGKIVRQLAQQLKNTQTPAEFLTISLELAWRLRDNNRERAQQLMAQAETFCSPEKLPDQDTWQLNHMRLLILKGFYEYRRAELTAALEKAMEGYDFFKDGVDDPWLCRSLTILAAIYTQFGNRTAALAYLRQKIQIAEAIGDEEEVATAAHNIGWDHLQAEEYEAAVAFFKQSLAIIRTAGNLHNLIINLCNLTAALIHLEQFDEAAVYLGEGIEVCKKHPTPIQNMVYQQFGLWNAKQGNLDEAIKQYQLALKITEQDEDTFSRINTIHAISRVYIQMGQPERAKLYLEEALTYS